MCTTFTQSFCRVQHFNNLTHRTKIAMRMMHTIFVNVSNRLTAPSIAASAAMLHLKCEPKSFKITLPDSDKRSQPFVVDNYPLPISKFVGIVM